jgi:hypothetical protein
MRGAGIVKMRNVEDYLDGASIAFGAENARRILVRKLCNATTWRDLGRHIKDNTEINLVKPVTVMQTRIK